MSSKKQRTTFKLKAIEDCHNFECEAFGCNRKAFNACMMRDEQGNEDRRYFCAQHFVKASQSRQLSFA